MIAKFVIVLAAVCVVLAEKPFAGVDPNSLQCDPAGMVHLLLPHFTECNKYYTCVHGREVEMPCGAGTIFDFELQGCNWERDTQCWLRKTDEEEEEGSGSGESFADFSEDYLSANGHLTPKVHVVSHADTAFANVLNCRDAEQAARQVPYKGDCQRYWRCEGGVPTAVHCSDGLFFNHATSQCDFEANSKCEVPDNDELKGEFLVYN